MTLREAEEAYKAAASVPVSPARIKEIVMFATKGGQVSLKLNTDTMPSVTVKLGMGSGNGVEIFVGAALSVIGPKDMRALVEYWLTNTPVSGMEDERYQFVAWAQKLALGDPQGTGHFFFVSTEPTAPRA